MFQVGNRVWFNTEHNPPMTGEIIAVDNEWLDIKLDKPFYRLNFRQEIFCLQTDGGDYHWYVNIKKLS